MVLYGQSSGVVSPFDLTKLSHKSFFVTRPKLFDYIHDRESLLQRTSDVFQWIIDGKLKLNIWKTYSLKDAAQAHRDLESRKAMGKILLLPELQKVT